MTTAEGKRLAKELGVYFEETSALTNDNVEHSFMLMFEGTCTPIQKSRRERNRRMRLKKCVVSSSTPPKSQLKMRSANADDMICIYCYFSMRNDDQFGLTCPMFERVSLNL